MKLHLFFSSSKIPYDLLEKLTRDPRIIEIKRRWKRKSSVDPKRKREQCSQKREDSCI